MINLETEEFTSANGSLIRKGYKFETDDRYRTHSISLYEARKGYFWLSYTVRHLGDTCQVIRESIDADQDTAIDRYNEVIEAAHALAGER